MDKFLSCDWGTSSFRLRLVQVEGLKVLAEEKNSNGIAETFRRWKDDAEGQNERTAFYQSHLHTEIERLQRKTDQRLSRLPLIISGMISSTIGMRELAYKALPFNTDGSDLNVEGISASKHLDHETFIISGVSAEDDVMRGEETMLVGCEIETKNEEAVFIFPGTHSKHVTVQNGIAKRFQTYMTGEFFDLLSSKSILSNSIEKDDTQSSVASIHFARGFYEGLNGNLLNTAFHIRTNQLFKKNAPGENYEHLSGLMIGTELKDLKQAPPHAICLVCSQHLKSRYWQGLQLLNLTNIIEHRDADDALIRGQWKVFSSALKS